MSYAPIYSEPATKSFPNTQTNTFNNHNNSRTRSISKISRHGKQALKKVRNHSLSDLENYTLLVHCHLCWDWVWQRPQQFISRLSQKRKAVFVETIAPDPALVTPIVRHRNPEQYPNITVLTLQFPAWRWHDNDYVDEERRRLVKEFLDSPLAGELGPIVQWFYDPMAVTAFAGQMDEVLTIYDCMDELSKFRCAPPAIVEREAQLLDRADLVFTGGRKLFESKSRFNKNCHFYGCGVDVAHFGSARDEKTEVPVELANLRRPVLGYFGVVDERMDYELIAKLADANTDWSVAIIGPMMKVDQATLPQRPNLHWLGKQPYEKLPAFCKGLDVCLMPFALNESTEFINPTKALEYMATGRPIVSSAVPDVVSNFGSVVAVANNHDEFIALCGRALNSSSNERLSHGLDMAARNSWERIVGELEGHVATALKMAAAREVAA
jgi:glycosyltransferase involved in cell wall biosynthesis